MLKKENRITKDKEFDQIFKTGQSFYTRVLGFKVIKTDTEISRFGILLGTKVSKKAVTRNLLKRRIREIIQSNLNNLKPGFDLVIMVLPASLNLEFKDMEEALELGFRRLGLYKK